MEDLKKLLSKNKWALVITLILIPIAIYALSVIPLFPSGNNDWAGFWGGYLGSIMGILGAILIMQKTSKEEKNNNKKAEKRQFYNQIIHDFSSIEARYKGLLNQVSYKDNAEKILIEKDKKTFLNECIQLNQIVFECTLHLQLAYQSQYYYRIEKLTKSFNDYNEICKKIINQLQKEEMTEQKKLEHFYNMALANLNTEALHFEIKRFIDININEDITN